MRTSISNTLESIRHTRTATLEETFRRIVCRYIGPHSQVRSKTTSDSYKAGFEALKLATKGTETNNEAGVSNNFSKTKGRGKKNH